MHVLRKAAVTMAIALPLSTMPLSAQFYRWDFNVFGGYSWLKGDVFDRTDFEFVDDEFDVDERVGFDNGFMLGAQLGYWFSKSFGLRGNFGWTQSGIEGHDNIFDGGTFDLFDYGVNLSSLTLDGMLRLNTPSDHWDGFEFLPYITLGLGATWIGVDDTDFRLVDDFAVVNPLDPDEDFDGINVVPIRCSAILDRCAVLEGGTRFTGLLGIGMDLRFSPSFATRLEFGDRIWSVAAKEVLFDNDFPFLFEDVGDFDGSVNQLYLTLGFAYLFGHVEPTAAAVMAPAPPPAPPPPPSTETISVCVVDPADAQGLRISTATHNLATGDTTVSRNGQSVPLSTAFANVPVAGNASWYIRGAPLQIGAAPMPMEFVSVGAAREIEPTELAYIGTVDGMPVFADRATVPPGLTNLGPNTDLNRLLMQSADARRALDRVEVLYVPLQPTGCVFQAMQKMQQVRKNKLEN